MMRTLISPVIAALLTLLLSAGCSGIRNDYQEKQVFQVEARPAASQAQDQSGGSGLLVKQFSISPAFEGSAFVYRTSQSRFGSDYYHTYIVPPARMITDVVAEALYASSGFSPVSPNTMADIEYQLWGKVTDLYLDIQDKDAPKAVISLRLVLDRNTGKDFTPVIHKAFSARVPMDKVSPEDYINSLNQGLTQILDAFFASLPAAAISDPHDE